MVSIADDRPKIAGLTPPGGGGRNTHTFKRVEGRTYSVCTVCGLIQRTPSENDAVACVPKARPIREEEPKLGSRMSPLGK
jgi:hypothetical protein